MEIEIAFLPRRTVRYRLRLPAGEALRKIADNIENKASFFAPDPERPFCGEQEAGGFSLGLNGYLNGRMNPFSRFTASVQPEPGGGSVLELTFRSSLRFLLFPAIAAGLVAFWSGDWWILPASVALVYALFLYNFNHKMNAALDEVCLVFSRDFAAG